MSGASTHGDHYSTVSANYAEFRPRYPRALFAYIASIAPARGRAWDCGAGSGQATIDLAEFFNEVIGTDVSAAQLGQAPEHPNVRWLVASAESTPIGTSAIDLTTVAQALHWFDHARFYAELCRVSAAGAAIVAWSYGAPRMAGDVGVLLTELMYGTLKDHWPPERRYVDEGYRTIPFPFTRLAAPAFSLEDRWTRARLAGYARSWSATARYVAMHGSDPVERLERDLARAWPDEAEPRRIEWPLSILAGRLS